jgi:hypothetical protein
VSVIGTSAAYLLPEGADPFAVSFEACTVRLMGGYVIRVKREERVLYFQFTLPGAQDDPLGFEFLVGHQATRGGELGLSVFDFSNGEHSLTRQTHHERLDRPTVE